MVEEHIYKLDASGVAYSVASTALSDYFALKSGKWPQHWDQRRRTGQPAGKAAQIAARSLVFTVQALEGAGRGLRSKLESIVKDMRQYRQ